MRVKVSIGEALDKLSILIIKKKNISDQKKLENVDKEYNELLGQCNDLLLDDQIDSLFAKLIDVNKKLWDIEDKIRKKEMRRKFDSEFIQLARSVYIINDHRAEIKKEINTVSNSELVEEKSYEKY